MTQHIGSNSLKQQRDLQDFRGAACVSIRARSQEQRSRAGPRRQVLANLHPQDGAQEQWA